MSEWIAFNAICYNLYHEKAIIERANIERKKSKLDRIHEKFNPSASFEAQTTKINGTIEKWNIDLSLPERLVISISNKNYTEDIIFTEFVKEYQNIFQNRLSIELFDDLKKSLLKGNRSYVINMAKSQFYSDGADIAEMAKKILLFYARKTILKL
jgi:hypothetical protein